MSSLYWFRFWDFYCIPIRFCDGKHVHQRSTICLLSECSEKTVLSSLHKLVDNLQQRTYLKIKPQTRNGGRGLVLIRITLNMGAISLILARRAIHYRHSAALHWPQTTPNYMPRQCQSTFGSILNENQFQSVQSLSNYDIGNGIWIGLKTVSENKYEWTHATPFDFKRTEWQSYQ